MSIIYAKTSQPDTRHPMSAPERLNPGPFQGGPPPGWLACDDLRNGAGGQVEFVPASETGTGRPAIQLHAEQVEAEQIRGVCAQVDVETERRFRAWLFSDDDETKAQATSSLVNLRKAGRLLKAQVRGKSSGRAALEHAAAYLRGE